MHVSGPDLVDRAAHPGSITIPSEQPDGKRIRGRDQLMKELAKSFSWFQRSRERAVVLHGLGGSGKTAAATVFAHSMQKKGVRVWWVSASSNAQLQSGLRQLVQALGAPDTEVDRAWAGITSASDLVWRYLAKHKGKWLLVFDNVDDASLLAGADSKISDGTGWLRRPAREGVILVTSRDGNLRHWAPWCRMQPVGHLSLSDATAVLMDYSDGQGGSRADAERLAERLGRLPLALKLAGFYLNDVAKVPVAGAVVDFKAYYEALETGRVELLDSQHATSDPEAVRSRETISRTWNLSIELLEKRGLIYVRPLFHLLAKFADAAIPYSLILDPEVMADYPDFREMRAESLVQHLQALAHVGLVDLKSDSPPHIPAKIPFLHMHPLVRDVSRAASAENQALAAFAVGLLTVAVHEEGFHSAIDPSQWPVWQYLAPHAIFFAVELASNNQPDPRLVSALGSTVALAAKSLRVIGYLWIAEWLLVTALGFMKHGSTRADKDTQLDLRHELAIVLIDQGRTEEAATHLADLQQDASAGGANIELMLAVRHEAAIVMTDRGDLDDAEREFKSILAEMRLAGFADDDRDTLGVELELALVLMKKKSWDKAEEILDSVLERCIARFGKNNEVAARSNLRLGSLHRQRGRPGIALLHLNASLDAARSIYLPDSPMMLALRHERGIVLGEVGRKKEAKAELEAVVAACIRVLGEEHPNTQTSIRALEDLDN
ncbi:tetratricopeptide repeat protein [Micromonospora tulbaghiae]